MCKREPPGNQFPVFDLFQIYGLSRVQIQLQSTIFWSTTLELKKWCYGHVVIWWLNVTSWYEWPNITSQNWKWRETEYTYTHLFTLIQKFLFALLVFKLLLYLCFQLVNCHTPTIYYRCGLSSKTCDIDILIHCYTLVFNPLGHVYKKNPVCFKYMGLVVFKFNYNRPYFEVQHWN
jgi:hypothetical protein